MTFTEEYRNGYADWLKQDKFNWSYIGTYRPKKSKVNSYNALRLFNQAVTNYCNSKGSKGALKYLYYTIEQDRSTRCNHIHFVIDSNSNKVDRIQLATAMKRHPTKELLYFEQIQTIQGAINYVTKRIGKQNIVTGHNLVVSDYLELQQVKKLYPNYEPHPNEEYHKRAVINSRVGYGWMETNRF